MKSISVFFTICLVVVKDIGIDCEKWELNTKDLCEKKWKELSVNAAFKLENWVGILGFFVNVGSVGTNGAIKALYHPFKDPSGKTKYEFFNTEVFKDLQDYSERLLRKSYKNEIRFAFTAKGFYDKLLDNQKKLELVFIVHDEMLVNSQRKTQVVHNATDVLEFDYEYNYGIPNPHRPSQLASMKLLNEQPLYRMIPEETLPYEDEDNSKMLNLKLLYLHFPDGVDIEGIIIVNLKGKDQKDNYYAIVYTEETVDDRTYAYRHYLRSKLEENENYRILEWEWDRRSGQCHETHHLVKTVMLLSVVPNTAVALGVGEGPNDETTIFTIKLLEFRGYYHNLVELEINDKTWTVTEKRGEGRKNSDVFLNCDSHPEFEDPNKTSCAEDVALSSWEVLERDIVENVVENKPEQRSEQQLSTNWLVFGVILTLMGIIVMIAFAVFFFVDSDPND